MADPITISRKSFVQIVGNRAGYTPNPDDTGDPNNPFGPYGPGGPVLRRLLEFQRVRGLDRVALNPQPLPPKEILAVALSQSVTDHVSPALHGTPLHEVLMGEYVAWAEGRAREAGLKKLWPFWAMEYDTVLARLHQAHGYVAVQPTPPVPLFERTLDALPAIRLPDGFRVQGVSKLEDGKLRAAVLHSHFRPNGDWHEFWAEYQQFMGTAVYDGARDLFVRSPDGRGASACTIWFDPVNGVGLFELVATHPDFQGKGLGKAVMAEGLHRMKTAGMKRAVVGFDPTNGAALALYTSMGFGASAYFTFPGKELT